MTETDTKPTRRRFLLAGSAVATLPLLAELTSAHAEAATAEANKTAKAVNITSGKVYYINDGCVGCQVCRTYCPAQAIRFGNCRNEIVQSKCIHCGTCYNGCNVCNISETELS